RVGSTAPRSVHVSGFASLCLLTPRCRLYPLPVRRASALPPASFRPPVARVALAVQLAFPRVGYAEDFHLQESAPCRAHKEKRLVFTHQPPVDGKHTGGGAMLTVDSKRRLSP